MYFYYIIIICYIQLCNMLARLLLLKDQTPIASDIVDEVLSRQGPRFFKIKAEELSVRPNTTTQWYQGRGKVKCETIIIIIFLTSISYLD